MRRLIINADDFGLTPGVNRAVAEAAQRGVVTSTTLMANGPAFDHAIEISHTLNLPTGCHIVLTDGLPLQPRNAVPGLVDETGRLHEPLGRFLLRAVAGRIGPDQIESEATAQIRRLQSAGIAVTHLDTHKHTHLFPQILRRLLRAAKFTGVAAIRNPFGPVHFRQVADRPSLWKRYGQTKLLGTLAGKFRKAIERAGMQTTDGTVGIVGTGALDQSLFEAILKDLPDGTWELVCHPGYNDADLDKIQTRLRASREQELQFLTSAKTRQTLRERAIELISYRELAAKGR